MKYKAIALDDMRAIMEELTREITSIIEKGEKDDREALNIMLGSLLATMSEIFAYLPEEERSHILVNCATWYDVGLLVGRSPGKLTKILDKVNPAVEDIELPDWARSMVKLNQD